MFKLVSRRRAVNAVSIDWVYDYAGRWQPEFKDIPPMMYLTRGEALFALTQTAQNHRELYDYLVEEVP